MTSLMLNNNMMKKTLVRSLSIILLGAGSSVMAHTTIQNQVTGSATSYNNIVIGHTCSVTTKDKANKDVTKKFPVVAQSVLFPTVDPVLYEGTSTTPSTLLVTDIITSATGLAGIPQLIQNKDIFAVQSEKTDANGNVIGFNGYNGNLDPTLHGLVPFRTGAVSFTSTTSPKKDPISGATISTTDSCVTKLVIKVAIADICKKKFPVTDGEANLWIPNTTAKFTNVVDGTSATPLAGSPATLTINRDTIANPLDSNCNGTGKTVTVWPSDKDIDANLIIPKVWSK